MSIFLKSALSLQFLVLIAIYTKLGLMASPQDVLPLTANDLLMHFGGYIVATFSISLARPNWRLAARAALLIIFSILIEILQHFNPPRTFSIADILANSAGVLLGILVTHILSKKFALVEHFFNHRHYSK